MSNRTERLIDRIKLLVTMLKSSGVEMPDTREFLAVVESELAAETVSNSTELIALAEQRYRDLSHKNWEWSSFYNGFLEGADVRIREAVKEGAMGKELTEADKARAHGFYWVEARVWGWVVAHWQCGEWFMPEYADSSDVIDVDEKQVIREAKS